MITYTIKAKTDEDSIDDKAIMEALYAVGFYRVWVEKRQVVDENQLTKPDRFGGMSKEDKDLFGL
jgi:hypothetical protein